MRHIVYGIIAFMAFSQAGFAGDSKVIAPLEDKVGDWNFEAKVTGGWRADYLRWKVRFPEDGGATGVSVLTWSQVQSITTGVHFETTYRERWMLRATGSFGGAVGGFNTDSDYTDGFQYSKSVSSARGSTFWDTSLAFGYHIPFHEQRLVLTPLIGLQYQYAWLRMRGGAITVGEDSGESLSDLNNSYRPNIFNGFVGSELAWMATPWLKFSGGLQLGLGYYYARAQWNLRDEFAQPLSFVHNGLAWTIEGNLGAEVMISRQWSIFSRVFSRGSMVVDGRDRIQFSDGSSSTTQLVNMTWATLGVDLGVGFRF